MENSQTYSGGAPIAERPRMKKATQLVKESWAIYKGDFKNFAYLALLIGLFSFLTSLFSVFNPEGKQDVNPAWWIYIVVVVLAYIVISIWGGVALVYKAVHNPEKLTVGQAFNHSKSKVAPVFWTGILSGLIILGGFILLIIPGIIFAIWYSLAENVVIAEGLKGWAALKRSKFYVKGYAGSIVARGLVAGLMVGLPIWIIEVIISALIPAVIPGSAGLIITLFLTITLSSLAAPMGILVSYLIYDNMVQIKSPGATGEAPQQSYVQHQPPVVPNPIS